MTVLIQVKELHRAQRLFESSKKYLGNLKGDVFEDESDRYPNLSSLMMIALLYY